MSWETLRIRSPWRQSWWGSKGNRKSSIPRKKGVLCVNFCCRKPSKKFGRTYEKNLLRLTSFTCPRLSIPQPKAETSQPPHVLSTICFHRCRFKHGPASSGGENGQGEFSPPAGGGV